MKAGVRARARANKQSAVEAGDRFYHGQTCRKCGGTEKYVAGSGCVGCCKAQARNRHHRNKCNPEWAESEMRRALLIVSRAVAAGELVRPSECSKCGERHDRIEGHHHDYDRPLDVTWLCPNCHHREHLIERTAA